MAGERAHVTAQPHPLVHTTKKETGSVGRVNDVRIFNIPTMRDGMLSLRACPRKVFCKLMVEG